MKRVMMLLMLTLCIAGWTGQASGAETASISVTVSLATEISVSIDNTAWTLGALGLGDAGAQHSATATNNGNVAVNLSIQADLTGANGWTIGAISASDQFVVSLATPATTLTTSPQSLATNVAKDGTAAILLDFTMPSADTVGGGESHDFSIVVTASTP